MAEKKLLWYFDYISPFAFLQWRQMQHASDFTGFQPKPILFAALLHHWGHLGPAEIPPKRRFTYRHVQWLAQRRGITLRFPPAHPFNPLKALRLTVFCKNEKHAIDAIFNYLWVQGRSLEDEAGFGELCQSLGVKEPDTALRLPWVKEELVKNGEEALAAGVFGVPTAVVDDVLFWGQDATEMLAEYLNDPAMLSSSEMERVSQLPIGVARR